MTLIDYCDTSNKSRHFWGSERAMSTYLNYYLFSYRHAPLHYAPSLHIKIFLKSNVYLVFVHTLQIPFDSDASLDHYVKGIVAKYLPSNIIAVEQIWCINSGSVVPYKISRHGTGVIRAMCGDIAICRGRTRGGHPVQERSWEAHRHRT